MRPRGKRRNWHKMSEDAWQAAGGRCEMCGRRVPNGTPYAHIIARSDTKNTSDGPENGAMLCLIGKGSTEGCHARLDANRGLAYIDMKAGPGCRLLDRIEADPKLKAYFERREARYKYIQRGQE